MNRSISLLTLPLLLLLGGCRSKEFVPPPPVTPQQAAPDFMSSGGGAATRTLSGSGFRFKGGDSVKMLVVASETGEQLANGTYRLNGSGQANLPGIGAIGFGGLTAADSVVAAEQDYRRAGGLQALGAHASIQAINGSPIVIVKGRVNKPGVVRFQNGMSIGSAIKAAGGRLDGITATSQIVVRRQGVRSGYNLSDSSVMSMALQAGDIVTLPRTF